MNELECIRAFVKVAEVGSFTEAARQMNVAKSAVTKRINQLEQHLELQLFQRSTRRLSITEGGTVFYQRSIHVLGELEQAKADVSTLEWSLSGTLRVSCVSSFTQLYLADDLCEFRQQHPDLLIDFSQHDRYCDPVQEGFDLSIQTDVAHSEILQKVEIAPLKRLIVGSPAYLEKQGIPTKPEDLSKHALAHNRYIHPDFTMHFENTKEVVSVPFTPTYSSNTIILLRSAVMKGQCLAMMPIFFIEQEIMSGELVPVLTDYRMEGAKLCAFYRKSAFVPMKARIFLNFLKRKYGDIPPWEQRLLLKNPELSYALGIAP
ncbi:LysR family transcriptional regulator [Paraglaciecola polaris]|uniref:Transcriptional regulator, LysR family n=1 Tax=Paraglaciecola polaris LMG 21857 TaxID=1129793 RepID=K6YMY6_9ALTE|nr:LysR family transcriptional regulator [Paraglaciecola polaris]GAC34059.1 transcriptional regulator, LysR family [Paraglaciecola polaris LMG 21857]